MMGHRQVEQAALFYEFSLERHIPADYLLRSIDRFVELDLRRELTPFYRRGSKATRDFRRGRQVKRSMSIWPFSMMLRSERRLRLPRSSCPPTRQRAGQGR